MTEALLQGLLPPRADEDGLATAPVWRNWNADDAEPVYANNKAADSTAVQRSSMPNWASRNEFPEALTHIGDPYFTPRQP